jgi:hypothetical protein
LSCLPGWASCLATKSWASLCIYVFVVRYKSFIVHAWFKFYFSWAEATVDLRQYNIAIYSSGRTGQHVVPLIYTPYLGTPVVPALIASEFYSGQLIFMSNLPSVVKKVKLHHCLQQLWYYFPMVHPNQPCQLPPSHPNFLLQSTDL